MLNTEDIAVSMLSYRKPKILFSSKIKFKLHNVICNFCLNIICGMQTLVGIRKILNLGCIVTKICLIIELISVV